MASPGATHGHVINSPNDHSPVIHIVAWLGIVISTLALLARMVTKWLVQQKVQWDDGAIIAAFATAIAQTLTISSAATRGVGKHIDDLNHSQIDLFQKSLFVSNLFFLLSLCLVKISVALIIQFIKPFGTNRSMCRAVGAGTILWTLTSVFLAAFQCSTPDTWKFIGNKCINRAGYWTFIHVASIVLDAALIVIPVVLLRELQVGLQRKLLVMGVFSSRIIVVGATLALVVFTIRTSSTADPSFDLYPVALTSTITMNLSIITACFPYLKPLLESLESGMIRSDDLFRRQGGSTMRYGRGYPLGPISKSASKFSKSNTASSRSAGGATAASVLDKTQDDMAITSKESQDRPGTERDGISNQFESVAKVTTESGTTQEAEVESQSSGSRFIKQTTTWMVSRERNGD